MHGSRAEDISKPFVPSLAQSIEIAKDPGMSLSSLPLTRMRVWGALSFVSKSPPPRIRAAGVNFADAEVPGLEACVLLRKADIDTASPSCGAGR